METGLQGKVALVTGSSRGIGAAIAEAFASQGTHVVINYLQNQERAESLAKRLQEEYLVDVLAIQADIKDASAVSKMVEDTVTEFGRIDILVNNALAAYTFNPSQRKLAWQMEWADYQQQLDGSLQASFHTCQAVIPYMKAKATGRIINILSDLVYRPSIPYHDYNTAKGALLAFSQNLAADLGAFGITVNCLAPGLVYPTDASKNTKEETKELLITQTPLRRIATPQDIVGSVLFFASEWSSFVTGQCLVVDGGLVMK